MPLQKLEQRNAHHMWGLWKIEEDEHTLYQEVNRYETIPETITHPLKRLEFIAGRVLAKRLLEKFGESYTGIRKDSFGKPFYNASALQLSLSHSYPYVAALVDRSQSVGIDVEQVKPKLLKIAGRVLHPDELKDAGDEVVKHSVYWCAKEAMLKVHGKKDLIFASQLLVAPFTLQKQGELSGKIIIEEKETLLPLHYEVLEEVVIVFNT